LRIFPNDVVELLRVEMRVHEVVLSTGPDYGSTEGHREPSLKVDTLTLKREVGYEELR
jgi:hypothetical protein